MITDKTPSAIVSASDDAVDSGAVRYGHAAPSPASLLHLMQNYLTPESGPPIFRRDLLIELANAYETAVWFYEGRQEQVRQDEDFAGAFCLGLCVVAHRHTLPVEPGILKAAQLWLEKYPVNTLTSTSWFTNHVVPSLTKG